MKTFSLLAFISIWICGQLTAQEIPEPEFSLTPYYLKDNQLQPLEKVEVTMKSKPKALGYGGVEAFWAMNGSKSSVRFAASAIPVIVIKTEDNSDPSEALVLYTVEVKKEERRVKSFAVGLSALAKSKDIKVKISFKKIRERVYQITFDSPLTMGEYAFFKEQDAKFKVSCFGID